MVEQGAADRLVQRADRRHPVRQRPLLHTHTLTLKTLDARVRRHLTSATTFFRKGSVMSTTPHSAVPAGLRAAAPSRQAFLLLRTVFTVAPILFGLDKFANVLTDWPRYLAPLIDDIVPGTAQQAMYAVGVVEILAGIAVALIPRYGACWSPPGWPASSPTC